NVDGNWGDTGTLDYSNTNGDHYKCSYFGLSVTITDTHLAMNQSADCGIEWDLNLTLLIKDGKLLQGDQTIGTIGEDHIEFKGFRVSGESPFTYSASVHLTRDRAVYFVDSAVWADGYSESLNGVLTTASSEICK
ncbi:MAG: hypothetical protein AABZ55_10045, partial [Bdellovibrionota bacterium]